MIPDGQTEIKIKSQTDAVTLTAINVDQQTIAYIFADQKTEDQLKITCSKSSGLMLSIAGSMTESTRGSIFQNLLKLHVSAYREMLSSQTKTELEVKPPDLVTIPEADKVEAPIPLEQVSVPEITKAEPLPPAEQASIPETENFEAVVKIKKKVISRSRSGGLG